KYSFYQILLYDREEKGKIYDVVDNRDLFQRGLGPIALEITSKNRVKKMVQAYRDAFHRLQKNPNAKFAAGTAGATILRLWGRQSSARWAKLAGNLRTQPGQRDRVMQGLMNADRFIPAMESIFRKYDIPHEITRITLVESSFNLNAVSKADAVGVWQFLERSAREYIKVDHKNKIDERLSPIKTTYAAAKMLKRNYKLLKDWSLAIIAYNHGAKNLIPIRDRYQGQKIVKLLSSTKDSPLGYASKNYYAEFLAMVHAEAYRDELYGFKRDLHHDAISIVTMKRPASIFEIASHYNISVYELRIYNPDIFDVKRKLPKGTRIVLPRKVGETFVRAPQIDPERKAPSVGPDDDGRGIASEVETIQYIK
ncbi:MAG: lytic transglycosylase domain-containing protein, partial [Bdellovibrionota bacterium]